VKDLIFVTAYCPDQEQIDRLSECIDSLPNDGFDIALISHSHIPLDVQKKCQFYIYDYLNELSDDEELKHFEFHRTKSHFLKSKYLKKTSFYGFAIYRMFSTICKLAKNYGYERIYHVEYDFVIKDKSIFENHRNFLNKYDSVFYTIDEDSDMILGGLKSFNVSRLPDLFENYNRGKMTEIIKEQDLIPLEKFTKKIFQDVGNNLFISKNVIEKKVDYKKFVSQDLNWCYCYNESDNQLYFFYSNIFNEDQHIKVESNKVKFKTTIQSKRFHIQNLGNIDEVIFLSFYRNETKASHINITEEFKSKIKKYSTIELF
jgi:hypothetical protein